MLDATERKALTLTTFAAACICLAPVELISGVALLLASLLLYRWDQAILRREAAAALAAGTVVATGAAAPEPAATPETPAPEPPAEEVPPASTTE